MIYSLKRVSRTFTTPDMPIAALDDIDLEVAEGEHVAVIGRSGSGKSTLFRLLNATLQASQGEISFCGHDIATMNSRQLREMRRQVGTVHQQHYLVKALSVMDNTLCGKLGSWSLVNTIRSMLSPAPSDVQAAMGALSLVGLADRAEAKPDHLSGGQQQRLAIARMLMQDSSVILADEPVASLDPAMAEEITDLLVRIALQFNRTLIVATHNAELALRYFQRVIGLRAGKILLDARPESLGSEELKAFFAGEEPKNGDPFCPVEPLCRLGCGR